MSILKWTHPNPDGVIEAFGGKGHYQIRWRSHGYTLTGVGHDRLPMLALSPGRAFNTLDRAKDYAQALERVRAVEPEASGA